MAIKIHLEFEEEDIPRLSGLFAAIAPTFSEVGCTSVAPVVPEEVLENPPVPTAPALDAKTDDEGTPYDPTEHSTPPKITKKGIWQKRRKYKHLAAPVTVTSYRSSFKDLADLIAKGYASGVVSVERITGLPKLVGHKDMTTLGDDPKGILKAIEIFEGYLSESE